MPHVKIAVAKLAQDFSYSYSSAPYSLMPNTKSYDKMQIRITKPFCYETCEVSSIEVTNVGKASSNNLI